MLSVGVRLDKERKIPSIWLRVPLHRSQRDIPLSWLTNTQRHLNTHLSIVNAGLPFTSILQIKCGSKKEKKKNKSSIKIKGEKFTITLQKRM